MPCRAPMSEVYLQYTSEYLKGPLYWHPDKLHLDCTRPIVVACLLLPRFKAGLAARLPRHANDQGGQVHLPRHRKLEGWETCSSRCCMIRLRLRLSAPTSSHSCRCFSLELASTAICSSWARGHQDQQSFCHRPGLHARCRFVLLLECIRNGV